MIWTILEILFWFYFICIRALYEIIWEEVRDWPDD